VGQVRRSSGQACFGMIETSAPPQAYSLHTGGLEYIVRVESPYPSPSRQSGDGRQGGGGATQTAARSFDKLSYRLMSQAEIGKIPVDSSADQGEWM